MQEKGKAVARLTPLRSGWQHNTVGCGPEDATGEVLQHIADVDREVLGVGANRNPVAFLVEHFESVRRAAYEQSDQIDVFMASRPWSIGGASGAGG